jgi:hypothetical protein
MTINLRSVISNDNAIKSGGFTGAVFLTYTLNLTFYEQMIAPMLDQAGCANVLILVDPDGYSGALEMGAKTISDVGMRYVCAPLMRTGRGVQHAKMLLMAGKKRGRLLIGSGNLTLHGFGRNLELFSHFECDPTDCPAEEHYPFIRAWQLIQEIAAEGNLPLAARNQLNALKENVPWLSARPPEPPDFRIWHNFDQPILDQLTAWRAERGWSGVPIPEFFAISPYFDHDIGAVQRIADDFLPNKITVHLDPALTNLNGSKAANDWSGRETPLKIAGIGPSEDTSTSRHVHAKAIIGHEADGAWCIAGSANLTRLALLRSWQTGGNLELVTFRWSRAPDAFDHLFHDPTVKVWPLDLADVTVTEAEPSERPTHLEHPFVLTDLSVKGTHVVGSSSGLPVAHSKNPHLRFLRNNQCLPIQFETSTTFNLQLPAQLDAADAARLEAGELATPYRWIDQPEILARYGARTYHVRVKGKLETIQGAGQLFEELMNYLWDRVDPSNEANDQDPRLIRRHLRSVHLDQPGTQDIPTPPGPEGFITDQELVKTLHWGVESHQPYNRSLLSLRDLLSLVLLRLTTTTQAVDDTVEWETRDEEADQQRQAEQEAQQVKAVERLRNYLLGYCKRYARRLVDPGFVNHKNPEVVFQNHYTLSRVLLEFASKADSIFTRDDLYNCFWWIWGPLIWPKVVGLEGQAALNLMRLDHPDESIRQAWDESGLPGMSIAILCEALGQPPNWKAGLWDKKRVATFMVASEWIGRIRHCLGENAFEVQIQDVDNAFGIRSAVEVVDPTVISVEEHRRLQELFDRIASYRTPMEEKYSPLIRLQALFKGGQSWTAEVQQLIEHIHKQGLSKEFEGYNQRTVPILPSDGDDGYCPRCGGMLTIKAENALRQGQLVLCTISRDAWIFYQPKMPQLLVDIN